MTEEGTIYRHTMDLIDLLRTQIQDNRLGAAMTNTQQIMHMIGLAADEHAKKSVAYVAEKLPK